MIQRAVIQNACYTHGYLLGDSNPFMTHKEFLLHHPHCKLKACGSQLIVTAPTYHHMGCWKVHGNEDTGRDARNQIRVIQTVFRENTSRLHGGRTNS